ncbi:MAG: hypothetical protein ABI665_07500 [Vicinamibacterales bacterium]
MIRRVPVVAALLLISSFHAAGQAPSPPTIESVLAKMADYVAAYGEKASLIVAVEKYSQSVLLEGSPVQARPRQLVAEFAIVKTSGNPSWVGFRDVVEVNGEALRDRRDRLVSLFTRTAGDLSEVARIANESARFNVGPVVRNFNVPTAAMFFFRPEHLPRFRFTREGTKKIDGVNTWEIAFKETRSPTFVMNRAGQDVPIDGALWVNPDDGTVVRTRVHMAHFADQVISPMQQAPEQLPPDNPTGHVAAPTRNVDTLNLKPIETAAEIDVTFRPNPDLGLWLPSTMEETYNGPVRMSAAVAPSMGHATTRAKYSEFKQFATAGTIVLPKQR